MLPLLRKYLISKMFHIKVFHYARPSGESKKRVLKQEVKFKCPMKIVLAAVARIATTKIDLL